MTDELSARLLAALGLGRWWSSPPTSLASLWTRTNTALSIESQGFAAACDLRPLAEPASVDAGSGVRQ